MRLIDADALIEVYANRLEILEQVYGFNSGICGALAGAMKLLETQPTIEPEQPEIIRCKDCRHYNAGFECLIEGYGIERNKDWFCADAERKEGEADG